MFKKTLLMKLELAHYGFERKIHNLRDLLPLLPRLVSKAITAKSELII